MFLQRAVPAPMWRIHGLSLGMTLVEDDKHILQMMIRWRHAVCMALNLVNLNLGSYYLSIRVYDLSHVGENSDQEHGSQRSTLRNLFSVMIGNEE